MKHGESRASKGPKGRPGGPKAGHQPALVGRRVRAGPFPRVGWGHLWNLAASVTAVSMSVVWCVSGGTLDQLEW